MCLVNLVVDALHKRSRRPNLHRWQHANLRHILIHLKDTLHRIHKAIEPKPLRLVHRQRTKRGETEVAIKNVSLSSNTLVFN
jgi:hypothetical protein